MVGEREITAIDIGSEKIAAATASARGSDGANLEISAFSSVPSRGMRDGGVCDIAELAASIGEVLERIESGKKIFPHGLVISVSSPQTRGLECEAAVPVGCRGGRRIVTDSDVENVLESIRLTCIPSNRELLHLYTGKFDVDEIKGIQDPVGVPGASLRARAYAITEEKNNLNMLRSSVSKAGYEVSSWIFDGIAGGSAILTEDEKAGVVLLDIGADRTRITVFVDGDAAFVHVMPFGGNSITHEISRRLGVSFRTAEDIKRRHGSASGSILRKQIEIRVPKTDGAFTSTTPAGLAKIIEPLVREKAYNMCEMLERRNFRNRMLHGIVVTGGTALMDGVLETIEDAVKLRARLGTAKYLGVHDRDITSPAHTTCMGLLRYASQAGKPGAGRRRRVLGLLPRFVRNTLKYLDELF